ncbi:MAG: Nif3-like dinuclear metal center hexameric protein [Clostridiales bacterium]|nr:Nif3-like dinuclear metal center hexameric protein [Clostridiales bacterium]
MVTRVKDITSLMEKLAPREYAMEWDNVGLQIGSYEKEVKKIIISLDITKEVLEEAIEQDIDLIISHHPIIFSPLKSIVKEDYKGNLIHKAISNNISIYATHTNMDIAIGGLNDFVAKKIGLENISILDITNKEKLYKIVVFIPIGYEEKVADALALAGAGHIGNYSHCSFRNSGTGTFKALEGTNPFIGEQGKLEKVDEMRLETIVTEQNLNMAINNMIKAHPYEEVAYDIFPLHQEGEGIGIGRFGKLKTPQKIEDLIDKLKFIFNLKQIRYVKANDDEIENTAIVNGSGAGYIKLAKKQNCQCLITGDVKYHDAQIAKELGISVIDAGHFETEIFFIQLVEEYLKEAFEKNNIDVDIMVSNTKTNPFKIL